MIDLISILYIIILTYYNILSKSFCFLYSIKNYCIFITILGFGIFLINLYFNINDPILLYINLLISINQYFIICTFFAIIFHVNKIIQDTTKPLNYQRIFKIICFYISF